MEVLASGGRPGRHSDDGERYQESGGSKNQRPTRPAHYLNALEEAGMDACHV